MQYLIASKMLFQTKSIRYHSFCLYQFLKISCPYANSRAIKFQKKHLTLTVIRYPMAIRDTRAGIFSTWLDFSIIYIRTISINNRPLHEGAFYQVFVRLSTATSFELISGTIDVPLGQH